MAAEDKQYSRIQPENLGFVVHIKICGIKEPEEVDLLNHSSADLAGIWYGVGGGRADLSFDRFRSLAREISATGRMKPVLVTFIDEIRHLQETIAQSGLEWVQLHGFQPPSVIAALKKVFGASLRIIKVLHVLGRHCLEGPLVKAYERAGTDYILFDAATPDGRLGSSGHRIDTDIVCALANRLAVPFLIAGGISAHNIEHHRPAAEHPRFAGFDVDSGARDRGGRLCAASIMALSRSCETLYRELAA